MFFERVTHIIKLIKNKNSEHNKNNNDQYLYWNKNSFEYNKMI